MNSLRIGATAKRMKMILIVCIIITYGALLFVPGQHRLAAVAFYQSADFDVIAHRNGRALMPGNTLEAAINALAVGADILELDIHLTADDVLVVRHDAVIDTTTNGVGAIAHMTLDEIQAYEVGFHEVDYPFLVAAQGIKVPTLASIFNRLPKSRYLIELKPTDLAAADQLCSLVAEHRLYEQVMVASFDSTVLRYFRQICPQVPTSLGESEAYWMVILSRIGLGHLYRSSGHSVQLPPNYGGFEILTPSVIKAAHDQNMRVEAWTINDVDTMKALIDKGVDGIITDRPDVLSLLVSP